MAQVDIIMALYNKSATVARALRSIRHQTLTDWHLFVIDDGSTDDGPDIVADLKDDRIELIRQDNRGPGAARNVGIARATGEFLTFLDADDEWYPWFLQNSLKALRENNVSLAASMYYLWPQGTDMTPYWAARGAAPGRYCLKGDEDPIRVVKFRAVLKVLNVLMRTEVARKYDGFYEKNHCLSGEDTTFFLRVLFGEPLMLIGPPAARRHSESGELGIYSSRPRPVPPYLSDPDEVLRYCPAPKRPLMQKTLDYLALVTARRLARQGLKNQAQDLLHRFPQARLYRRPYYRCRYELALSSLFPYWIKFKRAAGAPVRDLLKSLLTPKPPSPPPPAMPYENQP